MYTRRRLVSYGATLFSGILLHTAEAAGLNVVVIAHSLSTRRVAREVLRKQGWTEITSYRQADGILVVCRSGLTWPLDERYSSVKQLNDAAESQLNISGSNVHIYVYAIEDDLSVSQAKHVYYPFKD